MSTGRRLAVCALYAALYAAAAAPKPAPTLAFQFPIPCELAPCHPTAIAVDADGYTYVTGSLGDLLYTADSFPATSNAAQKTPSGAFVEKIDRSGTRVVWSTFLGGPPSYLSGRFSGSFSLDSPTGIAVDAERNVWVAGTTTSAKFPLVNPLQTDGGSFLVKLNAAGSQFLYATRFGTSGTSASAVAIDAVGNAYVALYGIAQRLPLETRSLNDPTGGGVAVAKFNPAGGIVYATRFGSGPGDKIVDLTIDPIGQAHVIGTPGGPSFPLVKPAMTNCATAGCSFVAALDASGTGLLFSTYLGARATKASATSVAADGSGATYVTGRAIGDDFVVQGAYQSAYQGGGDYFLTKFTSTGALAFSTYLGGDAAEASTPRVVVDLASRATVIGDSTSVNWPNGDDIRHFDAPLYKTVDAGATWRRITGGLRTTVYALAATTSGTPVWYAGTADGVYTSIDGGETWRPANDGLDWIEGVFRVVIDPAHADTAFAGTQRGLYRTHDRGAHWTKIDSERFGAWKVALALAVDGNGAVFEGSGGSGLRRSLDGGDTWTDVSAGLRRGPTGVQTVVDVVFDQNHRGAVYALDIASLYRSDNGGSSWRGFGTLPLSGVDAIAVPWGRPHRLFALEGNRLFRSDDDGNTWQTLPYSSNTRSPLVTIPQEPDSLYIVDFDRVGRIFPAVSRDAGVNWETLGVGSFSSSLTCLAVDPRGPRTLLVGGPVNSRALIAGFDQSGQLRYTGFATDTTGPAAQDPAGAVYIVSGRMVFKYRTP